MADERRFECHHGSAVAQGIGDLGCDDESFGEGRGHASQGHGGRVAVADVVVGAGLSMSLTETMSRSVTLGHPVRARLSTMPTVDR